MILLGLDPGLRYTGWGLILVEGNRLRYLADGCISPNVKLSLPERLSELYDGVQAVIRTHHPDEAAVEETFVNQNPASTLKLGQARGVVLLAPAQAGLPVAEYATRLVKQSVVGTGRADKAQVGMMVRTLLPGCQAATEDAADALAVAICHAHHRATAHRLMKALA